MEFEMTGYSSDEDYNEQYEMEMEATRKRQKKKDMTQYQGENLCAQKFPPTKMGGQAGGLVCTDLVARTPIDGSRNFSSSFSVFKLN
jgi:hypothetical protein